MCHPSVGLKGVRRCTSPLVQLHGDRAITDRWRIDWERLPLAGAGLLAASAGVSTQNK